MELQVHKCLFQRVYCIISGNINPAFSWTRFGSCTWTGEMAWPFPSRPGIERRRDLLIAESNSDKHRYLGWPFKGHNRHIGSVGDDVVLSCDWKETRIIDVNLHRFITIDRVNGLEVYTNASS